MVECGMSPMDAIVASTHRCAELLGIEGTVGTVEPGRLADLVCIQGDPISEIGVLADGARVRLVVKGGQVVRDETTAGVAVTA